MSDSPFTAVRGWGLIQVSASIGIIAVALWSASVAAQEAEKPSSATPSATAPLAVTAPGQGAADPSKSGEIKPEGDAKKSEGEKKPDNKSAEKKPEDAAKEKKPDEPPPVRRPLQPPKPPNPDELNVHPVGGKVSFSFKGQPWPAVLEWLADVSQMSLEWIETPPGYLDLTTRRPYTVDEARDLINYILMGRGYTLLRNGEVLMVAKLKDLDASLVPRVTLEELDSRDTFELVRVFFDLDRLQAEQLVEDLQPLKSTYGRIAAMKTTNRVDVLETAGNLRRLREIIGAEQSASGQETMLKEFPLHHARAEVVIVTLETLLGIEPKKVGGGPTSPEQMQQQMRQMMEQQQQQLQQQQHSGQGGAQKQKKEPKILLAVYQRKNAIYAQATPDKLAIIEQAIKLLDVPAAGVTSLDQQIARVRTYRLVAADPQVVVNLLKELGNLDPSTQLQVDVPNRIILADAPLADHYTIQELIKKIDGSARRLHVIQLRRLNAEYVAGSIEFLMRGPKQDERRPRYMWWDGGSRQNTEQKDGGFQVEADIEANRLLLRVNDVELQEIEALLVKLGEDPYHDPRGETMRVLHSGSGRETDQLLDRLRRVWPSISPVPLQIDVEPTPAERKPDVQEEKGTEKPLRTKPKENPSADRSASAIMIHPAALTERTLTALAQKETLDQAVVGDERLSEKATEPGIGDRRISRRPKGEGTGQLPGESSVTVTRGPNGLIFSSQDPVILEQLMRLAGELSPQDARYYLFTLKHTYSKDMAALLTKIFADEGAKEAETGRSRFVYIWDESPPKEPKERGRLSKRAPLKFIPDPVTNTLLVQGADDRQLGEIRSLIEFYDRFEEPNSDSVRQNEFVTLKYAKAREVAEVLKEVFRDLLSPNDKSLMQYNLQKAQQEQQSRPLFSYWDSEFGSNKSPDENLPKFKGLLSIGVDQRSNSLFISAPGKLMKSIKLMAERLDAAAQPQEPVTRVVRMNGAITDPLLQEALLNFADPAAARRNRERNRQTATTNQNNQNNGRQQRNSNNWHNNQNNRNGWRNGAQPGGF